ncbi:MAG: LPP20 family lipoprotein [Treponema sp.]|nr:LPP20 family lipoprotein [Treponema sp.]
MTGKVFSFTVVYLFFSCLLFMPLLAAQTPEQADAMAREALQRLEAALGGNTSSVSVSSANTAAPSLQITQGGVQPAWVIDPYAAYDRGRYFAAVGSAPNRSQAEARALSALVAIFGQSIQSDFTVAAMYSEAVNNGIVNVSENTDIRDTITRAASMDNLIGAQIGYVWDSGRNAVYAAAYLDKERAVSIYTDLVIFNKNNIALLTNMSNEEKNTFDGLARYRLASQIAKINANYAVIINQSGGSAASLNLNNADYYILEANNIFRNITVTVSVDNDRANRVQNAFAGVLSSEGLRTRGNNPPYILEVFVFTSEVIFPYNAFKWCLIEVSANLIDNSTGASLFPFGFYLREGHSTYANAESRAYLMAEREISQKFPLVLREYLETVMP